MTPTKSEFLWKVHTYTNENIRFADTKALTVIAWTGAMLSTLVANKAFNNFLDGRLWADHTWFLGLVTLLGFVLLAAAFVTAIRVVAPVTRHGQEGPSGLIFWGAVSRYASADEFCKAVMAVADLDERVAVHIHELAGIAKKKFARVALSIWLAAAGTLLAIIVIFQP